MTGMHFPGSPDSVFQVVMIDLVLAGDNAVVIGLAAAGLPESQRKQGDSQSASSPPPCCASVSPASRCSLLQIIGLLLAGGASAALGVLEDVARVARHRPDIIKRQQRR